MKNAVNCLIDDYRSKFKILWKLCLWRECSWCKRIKTNKTGYTCQKNIILLFCHHECAKRWWLNQRKV